MQYCNLQSTCLRRSDLYSSYHLFAQCCHPQRCLRLRLGTGEQFSSSNQPEAFRGPIKILSLQVMKTVCCHAAQWVATSIDLQEWGSLSLQNHPAETKQLCRPLTLRAPHEQQYKRHLASLTAAVISSKRASGLFVVLWIFTQRAYKAEILSNYILEIWARTQGHTNGLIWCLFLESWHLGPDTRNWLTGPQSGRPGKAI